MGQHRRAAHIVLAVLKSLSAMSNYEVDLLLHPAGADDADRVNAEITLQRAVEAALATLPDMPKEKKL